MTEEHINHNISESADKIRLKTKLTRGTETRDQETIEVTIKGDDPAEAVGKLNEAIAALEETAENVRRIQPGREGDE